MKVMKVVKGLPPNYFEIHAAFPHASRPGVIFAWGDTIYDPTGGILSRELVAHESVHGQRQNGDPATWWRRYIEDPRFRLMEELLAHRAEYLAHCDNPRITRNQRRIVLRHIAQRIASPLYGSLISVHDAKIAITTPDKHFDTRLDQQAA